LSPEKEVPCRETLEVESAKSGEMALGGGLEGARNEAVAGCVAGVLGTLLGYPLDSLKTRMQAGAGQSLVPLARRIYGEEGFWGFYRGVASPLAALTILNTLNFSTYATLRKQFGVGDILAGQGFDYRVPMAAACVGPLSSLISTPFELIKTQMVQAHANAKAKSIAAPTSSISHTASLVRQHGARVLFVAHGVNTLREVVFLSTYFSVYEHSKAWFSSALGLPAQLAVLVAGGISGSTGWFISFPLDCIKSNMQGRPFEHNWRQTQPSALGVARQLLRQKGIAGLYSGVVPSIARAFIVSSSRFAAYEGTLWMLR